MPKPPCNVRVVFNLEPLSKAYAEMGGQTDQGNSAGYESCCGKYLEMPTNIGEKTA
jgi:hypothetical protein